MENNLINEKESKIIKPHELSINDSESSNIISLSLKPKTNRNRKEGNKALLKISRGHFAAKKAKGNIHITFNIPPPPPSTKKGNCDMRLQTIANKKRRTTNIRKSSHYDSFTISPNKICVSGSLFTSKPPQGVKVSSPKVTLPFSK